MGSVSQLTHVWVSCRQQSGWITHPNSTLLSALLECSNTTECKQRLDSTLNKQLRRTCTDGWSVKFHGLLQVFLFYMSVCAIAV